MEFANHGSSLKKISMTEENDPNMTTAEEDREQEKSVFEVLRDTTVT